MISSSLPAMAAKAGGCYIHDTLDCSSVCRYKYKYKQRPELSLSASDIPLGESVPQLPSLFPTAHYHFTYRHQTSCYGEHKAKYLRVWDQRMSKCFQPRSCCCRGHWPLALAVAWCRVNKQSWPRQISRTELWTVPRSQLFTQPRPDLNGLNFIWCIVFLKPHNLSLCKAGQV